MEINLDFKEVEKFTGLKSVKYDTPKSITANFGVLRKKVQLLGIKNNTIILDFGLIINLVINKKQINKWKSSSVQFKLKNLGNIEVTELIVEKTGVKIKGKI